MDRKYRWVWNGTNAEDVDKDVLRLVRKLIILDGIDEPEIVEALSQSEYDALTNEMTQNGWKLEETNVKGNPRTTCWVREVI